jgi:hypothetical protein
VGIRQSAGNLVHEDPASIRLELIGRLLAGRDGWVRTSAGWRYGAYDLVPRVEPQLPYELWKGGRRVAALMTANHAIKVCEHVSRDTDPTSEAPGAAGWRA